jgi:hypothetical protein
MDPRRPAADLTLHQRLSGCLRGIITAEAAVGWGRSQTTSLHPASDLILAALETVAGGQPPGRVGQITLPTLLPLVGHPTRSACWDALIVLGLPVGLVWSASPTAADRATIALLDTVFHGHQAEEERDYARALTHLGVQAARRIPLTDSVAGLAQVVANWPEPQRSVGWYAAHPEQADDDLDVTEGGEFRLGAIINLLHGRRGPDFDAVLWFDDLLVAMTVGGVMGMIGGAARLPPGYTAPIGMADRIERLAARLAYIAHDGQAVPFSGWQRP